MPMYNSEKTAEAAIKSILSQKHSNLSLVIVDDCSTDQSLAIARYFLKDPRVSVYQNTKNMGAYYSRNLGLYVSRNEQWDYFTTHDADDVSSRNRYSVIMDEFSSKKNVIAVQDTFERVDLLSETSLGISMTMAHAVFSRQVFDDLGYFDNSTRFAADWEHWQRVKMYSGKFKNVKIIGCTKTLGKSYVHQNNLTVTVPVGSKPRMQYVERATKRLESMQLSGNFYSSFEKPAGISKKINSAVKTLPDIFEIKKKKVHVVLLTWKRLSNLKSTLSQLSRQTNSDFSVYISNGNLEATSQVERASAPFSDKLKLEVHHDGNEYYSFRRLLIGKKLASEGSDIVIFLDDDVSIPDNFVEKCLAHYEPKTYQSWYAWFFTTNGNDYFERERVTTGQQPVHYGGAGISMVDSSIFLQDKLIKAPKPAHKIEDLWLSYFVSTLPGWSIRYLPIKDITLGGADAFALHKQIMSSDYTKTDFLRYLVKTKKWKLKL